MKVSIITTTYNSAKTVGDTVKSVLSQTYNDIEYIIVDDGSTDETLDVVNKSLPFGGSGSKIVKVVPGKHGGMYDAMNRGLQIATGDIIGIMNSDDMYASNDAIEMVVNEFERSGADCVWGDLVIIDRENVNRIVRNWKSSPYEEGSFQKGWHPPHTAFFVKKEVYDKYGMFRTDLGTSADYELMLRFLERYKVTSSYIPKVLVKMRAGGLSSRGLISWIKGNIGSYKAFRINGLKVGLSFIILKPLRKLGQFISSK